MTWTCQVPSWKAGRKLDPKVAARARLAPASASDAQTTLRFQRRHRANVGR